LDINLCWIQWRSILWNEERKWSVMTPKMDGRNMKAWGTGRRKKTKIKKGRKKLFTVQMIWQILEENSFDSNLWQGYKVLSKHYWINKIQSVSQLQINKVSCLLFSSKFDHFLLEGHFLRLLGHYWKLRR